MDQLREKESRSARVTRPGECARMRAAVAAAAAAAAAATAQVKVHWRKRELTETHAQRSQVRNPCISLKSLSRVYIETSAKVKEVTTHAKCKMIHGKDINAPWQIRCKRVVTSMLP